MIHSRPPTVRGRRHNRCGRSGRWETRAFTVGDYRLPRGFALGSHAHDRAGAVVALSGVVTLTIEGRQYEASRETAVLLPAGAVHDERTTGDTRCLLVELSGSNPIDGFDRILREPGTVSRDELLETVVRLARELDDRTATPLGIDADITELFFLLQGSSNSRLNGDKAPGWVDHVLEALRARWRKPPTLVELAADVGVTPEHLARVFRRTAGCTVGDYLRRQRLLAVARDLRETSAPLSAIAYGAGYADQSHMTRQFRRYFGLTPGRYRVRA